MSPSLTLDVIVLPYCKSFPSCNILFVISALANQALAHSKVSSCFLSSDKEPLEVCRQCNSASRNQCVLTYRDGIIHILCIYCVAKICCLERTNTEVDCCSCCYLSWIVGCKLCRATCMLCGTSCCFNIIEIQ